MLRNNDRVRRGRSVGVERRFLLKNEAQIGILQLCVTRISRVVGRIADSLPYDMVASALRFLGSLPRATLASLLFALTCIVGVLDYAVGTNATFVSLYLIPMGISAWFLGLPFAYIFASLSTVFWVMGDVGAGVQPDNSTLAWNLLSRFAVFIAVSHLVRALRRLHDDVDELAKKRSAQLVSEIEARQRLEQELVHISEREQRRVGHDIHDSLCQHLTATALAGQVLVQALKAQKSASADSAVRVVQLIEDGIALSRNVARGLNSVGRSGDGLMEALEDFAVSTNELFKISCRFECPLPVLINDIHAAEHLYRIAQEAVGNAIKHGRAKNIEIGLEASKAGKRLRIIDDGAGRPPFSANGKGMGLRIMSYRADRIGATFQHSPPGAHGHDRELLPSSGAGDDFVTKSKVFIVDDHPLVREWLTTLIDQTTDLVVCDGAEDVQGALKGIARSKPDLAIIDLSLRGESGIDLIRMIGERYPKVAMVVLSMHDERAYAERSIRAGARGYIMKSEFTKKVVDAIHQVLQGHIYLSKELTELFAHKFISGSGGDSSPVSQLSDREMEVFRFIGQGYETREISETLKVNIKTVQTYCTRIKEKLKLSSGAELLREAIRWNDTSVMRQIPGARIGLHPGSSNQARLLTGVISDDVAHGEYAPFHGADQRCAVGVGRIDVERCIEGKDLEVVGMRLAGRRLRPDIGRASGDVFALQGAILQSSACRHLLRESQCRGWDVVDDPVNDRL